MRPCRQLIVTVGATPKARMARSTQGSLSRGAVPDPATRNFDHAKHSQNRLVGWPAMTGPVPQSRCAHIPGSGSQGRCARR